MAESPRRSTAASLLAAHGQSLWEGFMSLAEQLGLAGECLEEEQAWRQALVWLVEGMVESGQGEGARCAAEEIAGRLSELFVGRSLTLPAFLLLLQTLARGCRQLAVTRGGVAAEAAERFGEQLMALAAGRWLAWSLRGFQRRLRRARKAVLQEKHRYAAIFYQMAEPACIVDSQLRLLETNPAFGHFFAAAPTLASGSLLPAVLAEAPGLRQAVLDVFAAAGSFSGLELTVEIAGEPRWLLVSTAFLGSVFGCDAAAILIIQDLTELQRMRAALLRQQQDYRALLENLPDVTWRADDEARLLFVSPNVSRICGYEAGQLLGKDKFSLVHPEDLPWVREEYAVLIAEGKPLDVTYRLQCRDGEWIWVRDRAEGVSREEGVVYADGVFADVTELALAEEELAGYRSWLEDLVEERTEELYLTNQRLRQEMRDREAAQQGLEQLARDLKRSNQELEQFAQVASHDMKEPLLLIRAFSDRLRSRCGERLDHRGQDYLNRIQRAAGQLQQLVDDLLQLSRVHRRGAPFAAVELDDLLREVVEDLEERIRESGGTVRLASLPTIEGDRVQLRQLFQNLIANALKYHRQGCPPRIEVRGRLLDSGLCEIEVEDNGIGFPEQELERILQPFERLHSRSEYEGTGIGLATCDRIVRRHGGLITARSQPGHGSVFVVQLPQHPGPSVTPA